MAPAPFRFPLKLGFGCSGAWGMRWFSERRATALIAQAIEGGVRHFDTAGFYADGEAERRLGRALKAVGAAVFVSTKTGTRYSRRGSPAKDFSAAVIRSDVEASLKRLGRDRIDLLYLHGPSRPALTDAAPTLEALRAEGKIERWGVCAEGAGVSEAIEAGAEAVMAVYNVFRREHAAEFRRAKAAGVGVVAIAPLAQALYARNFFRFRGAADGWRIARSLVKKPDELRRLREEAHVLDGAPGWTPAQIALGFAQGNPDIDVAVTTTTKPRHLKELLARAGEPLPEGASARLQALA